MVGVVPSSRMSNSLVSRTSLDAPYTALMINPAVGLDGFLIVLAMVALSIFHPGRLMIQETSLMELHSQSVIEMVTRGL